MRRNVKNYLGSSMRATDGGIGHVSDVYFDDKTWSVLYFVVETGDWLAGRKLLISPQALAKKDWDADGIQVDLTKEKLRTSPEFDAEKPVSRQYEMDLYSHFHWSEYWPSGNWPGGMGTVGMITTPALPFEEAIHEYVAHEEPSRYHIRSMRSSLGDIVKATDGNAGHLHDLVFEDQYWTVTLLVVDGNKGLTEKRFALPSRLVENSGSDHSGITVKAQIKQIEQSPEYRDGMPVNENYEAQLNNYYQQFDSL